MVQRQTTVVENMTRAPIWCKVSDPLREVIYKMAQAEINALLVVDEKNITRGIISQVDILEHYAEVASLKASDVMSTDLVEIRGDASIEEAAHLIVEKKVSRLIIPDPGRPGVAMGILSASDIIRALVEDERRTYLPVQI